MIVVAGLVLVFVLILIFGNRRTRACRWRRQRDGWRCASCGARAPGEGTHPPKVCLDEGYRRG
ncbi:hypothetical protein [Roseovarius amoyensis]|uniref:hypothetical protein n=1 Tax=Roseovarius amoyensis TaxID=2211448 RepID=UPI000DBE8549|nr:hypothetical protein [Roseovarius amoyensis]